MSKLSLNFPEIIADAHCPPDRIYVMSPSQLQSYRRLGYSQRPVLWEPGVKALDVAGRSGWTLVGMQYNKAETTWHPDNWSRNAKENPEEREREAWTRILENTLAGCPVAYEAMKQVVSTNPDYKEYEDTILALENDFTH